MIHIFLFQDHNFSTAPKKTLNLLNGSRQNNKVPATTSSAAHHGVSSSGKSSAATSNLISKQANTQTQSALTRYLSYDWHMEHHTRIIHIFRSW